MELARRVLAGCDIVAPPNGYFLWMRLPEPWPRRLARTVFRGHVMDISSTEIRARVAAGLSLRYLVTPAVAGYIRKKKLYR